MLMILPVGLLMMGGGGDGNAGLTIHRKSQELMSQGGFMFRAWHSNSACIRDVIAAQESCAETTKGKATQSKHDNQNADPEAVKSTTEAPRGDPKRTNS